jgi:biopolymer transport protein ExbD
MSSRAAARKAYRAQPSMNVTPLVDVVLVLLIIFMVVIPALQQGVTIDLPGVSHPDEKKEGGGQPFTLSVSKDGDAYFEEDQVPWAQLEAKLKEATKREPGRRLVLRGDKNADYGLVRRAYRAAQQVGFPGVSMKVNHQLDDAKPAKAN